MNDNNGKMEFTYQFADLSPKVTVTLSAGSALPEVLESFEAFLRAAGYHFDGQVDIIEAITYQDPKAEEN